jgi:hypothetical protein
MDAAHQELHTKQRLAAAGAAGNQSRAPARQSTLGEFVEARNSSRRFG